MRLHLVVPLSMMVLAACGQVPRSPRIQADPTSSGFRSGPATPSPGPTTSGTAGPATSTPANSPTESALGAPPCGRSGRIDESLVSDTEFGRELPYRIYLPPCYEDHSISYYPTLYLLHGLAADDSQWSSLGLVAAAEELISTEEIPPFLIVMPWQRTGLEVEPAIARGLPPHVEARFRARPGRRWRAIGGVSRGGGWAFRIGFRYPQLFSNVGLHSPAIFAGDLIALERWLQEHPDVPGPKVWIDVGDRDSLASSAEDLVARLEELGIAYEYHPGDGWHDPDYWSAHVDEYLRWYGGQWREMVPAVR